MIENSDHISDLNRSISKLKREQSIIPIALIIAYWGSVWFWDLSITGIVHIGFLIVLILIYILIEIMSLKVIMLTAELRKLRRKAPFPLDR